MGIFNAVDTYVWEPLQAKYPWLYSLDNKPWKTWIWHSVITLIGGLILAWTPWISLPVGLSIMLGYYAYREIEGIFEGNRNYFDAVMDVVCPLIASQLLLMIVRLIAA